MEGLHFVGQPHKPYPAGSPWQPGLEVAHRCAETFSGALRPAYTEMAPEEASWLHLQAWRLSELPGEAWPPRTALPAPRPAELPSPSTRGQPVPCPTEPWPTSQVCSCVLFLAPQPSVIKQQSPKGKQQDSLLWPQVSVRVTLQSSVVPSPQGAPGPLGFLSHSLKGL